MAVRARDFVRVTVGARVQLSNVRLGEYAGRVVADVWVNEQKLSDLLIAENLGRPYHGGRREGIDGLVGRSGHDSLAHVQR